MTATDEQHGQLDTGYPHTLRPELHKALMTRGIDYWVAQGITFWNRDDGCECLAYGYKADGVPKLAIKVVGFTDPEQAIAATLGDTDATGGRQCDAGTCELINAADDLGKGTSSCMCFECGYTAIDDWWDEFKYCPNCGRQVVSK